MEMDERPMIDLHTIPLVLSLPLSFAGGLVLGFVYFSALKISASLIVRGASPLLGLALALGRLAFLAAGFYVAVLAGGFALLAALAGVMLAKALMLFQARRDRA